MDWLAGKVGTIYQKPAHAIGLSTPPIGCVLDLPGLPGGGNKIYDRSPYGNHGTITGATWKRLPSGLWVLYFDGADDYFTVGDASTFKFLHGALDTANFKWTIEWWWALGNPEPGGLYSPFNNCQGGAGVGINIYYRDDGVNTRRFHLTIRSDAANVISDYSDDACYPNDTDWHHICITYDQTPATLNARFYVDAVAKGTLNKGATTPSTANAMDALHFGILSDAVNFPLLGKAALPRIYNRALSALEIQNHYQQEKHLFGVV